MVGNIDDVSQYYKEAEIFCLSSRFEGFPMVLLETLAFGLPVVSFNCDTGPAEVLEDTGSILVLPGSACELAISLIALMKNENRRKLIAISSQRKSENYQLENIIKKWIRIIED